MRSDQILAIPRLFVLAAIVSSSLVAAEPRRPAGGFDAASAVVIEADADVRVIVEFATAGDPRASLASRTAVHRNTMRRFRDDLARLGAGRRAASGALSPGRELSRGFSGVALALSPEAAAGVRRLPYVRAVHPDVRVRASAEPRDGAGRPAFPLAAPGVTGLGIRVAILDSGIDYRHPALGGGFGPGFKVAGGWDFVNDDADPADDFGHGTHVAGIVAASGAEMTGVAPGARLLAYKVLDAWGFGNASDILAAIDRALDPNGDGDPSDRAHVINLSLGAPGGPEDALSRAVDAAVAAGVVVCAAAGNSGEILGIDSPGAAAGAITVGAADGSGAVASFSARGPNVRSYTIKPDLLAPGVAIRSTLPGGIFASKQGTSMATPHVAGAAALLLEAHPGWAPLRVKSALMSTARAAAGSVMETGAGIVDGARAAGAPLAFEPASLAFGVTDGTMARVTTARSLSVIRTASPSPASTREAFPSPPRRGSDASAIAPSRSRNPRR